MAAIGVPANALGIEFTEGDAAMSTICLGICEISGTLGAVLRDRSIIVSNASM